MGVGISQLDSTTVPRDRESRSGESPSRQQPTDPARESPRDRCIVHAAPTVGPRTAPTARWV